MNDMLLSDAAIEQSSIGIGVSVSARKYWRSYWAQRNLPSMLGRNQQVNEVIGGDFKSAQPLHRFWLKSGEPAEIRRSNNFYYVAAMRGPSKYDVIVIQSRYKEGISPESSKETLKPEWITRGPRRK
jgi:hypothetical protein